MAMQPVAWTVIVPFCFAALVTGIVEDSARRGDYSGIDGLSRSWSLP
jgi:hypothetical protein